MSALLFQQIRSRRAVIRYFLLTYLDKGLAFLLPLSVLFITDNTVLYATIEAAFSWAMLFLTVMDLGITSYLFYAYRHSTDPGEVLTVAQSAVSTLVIIYFICGIGMFCALSTSDWSRAMLSLLVLGRVIFLQYSNVMAGYWRLSDFPARIYKFTLPVYVFTLLLIALTRNTGSDWQTVAYITMPVLFAVVAALRRLLKNPVAVKRILKFLSDALAFSWPVMLNVLAMAFVNNYAKIYAFNNLSQQEAVQVAFVLRIALIIQLTHKAFSSYFSKKLFMSETKQVDLALLARYSLTLVSAVVVAICAVFFCHYFLSSHFTLPVDLSTFFFFAYTVIWCYIGYIELYFNLHNANKMVLAISIIGGLVYLLLISVTRKVTAQDLGLYMVVSGLLNLLMLFGGLSYLRALPFQKRKDLVP